MLDKELWSAAISVDSPKSDALELTRDSEDPVKFLM